MTQREGETDSFSGSSSPLELAGGFRSYTQQHCERPTDRFYHSKCHGVLHAINADTVILPRPAPAARRAGPVPAADTNDRQPRLPPGGQQRRQLADSLVPHIHPVPVRVAIPPGCCCRRRSHRLGRRYPGRARAATVAAVPAAVPPFLKPPAAAAAAGGRSLWPCRRRRCTAGRGASHRRRRRGGGDESAVLHG